MARYRIGIDVGGTHTDMVLLDTADNSILIKKLPSTPDNPAIAVLDGVGRFIADGVSPDEVAFFGHGTTVTTNALLEMKGGPIGVLINRGMRGILEVQTQARDGWSPFDHFFRKPEPLARPSFIHEIGGRVDHAGMEIEPLNEADVTEAVKGLAARGVQSFAVCFLFSFVNRAHEERAAALIRKLAPDALVSCSSHVLPRIREWPRYSTTLLNAYLAPVLSAYCAGISRGLDATQVLTRQRFLMQSNGGVMPLAADAQIHTVRTLLSGPAAGVRCAGYLLGQAQGLRNLVTMDIGGTSCDIAFVEDGEPVEQAEATIDGRIAAVPAFDIATVAAGGGSIAWIGASGLIEVGPRSAGAAPGPVCYGKGGQEPTVTDANLVRGALSAEFFLGGSMKLDTKAARTAIAAKIATPMNVDVETAACGIVRIVNARMVDAIRVEAAKKGIDLAGHTLVPFGGAGPLHAAQVAEQLGMRRVLVPRNPGAFSALGLLCSDVRHDYMRSGIVDISQLDPAGAEAGFKALESQALVEIEVEGLDLSDVVFERAFDMRYAGQGYDLRISLSGLGKKIDKHILNQLAERFHDVHAEMHGHAARDNAVEIVSYRLRAIVPMPKFVSDKRAHTAMPMPRPRGQRRVLLDAGRDVMATIWRRDDFQPGFSAEGPAVVEQADATTLVPDGWRFECDAYDNLVLEKSRRMSGQSKIVDAVAVQIVRNRIASLMAEMQHRFFRSGYSTIVRESRDFSCVIVDAEGRLITSPPMFYHATAYYHLAQSIMNLFGREALADGDIFVSNHPYEGFTPHTPDMAIMAPVIVEGTLVAFAAAIAHKADVGGTVPGSSYGAATEMFQEGIMLPPVRFYAAGKLIRDLERLVAANSRQPALVVGDMRSQTGAVIGGRERMKELAREYGVDGLKAILNEAIDAAGREMEQALRVLPDGASEAETFLDNDGDRVEAPVRLHVKVVVTDGRVTFDFSGSDDQRRSPVNLRPPLVEAACFHALIALLDPLLRYSDSARRHVDFVLRPGSIVNANPPAPCSNYMKVCQRLIDVVIEALNPFCPRRAAAHAGGSGGSIVVAWGAGERVVHHNQHEIFGSSYGGTAQQDGASATTVHMSNIYVTPIEIVETEFPCIVTRFELIPDSGGAGEYRGGNSFCREYRALQPGVVLYRGDKTRFPSRGVMGGSDGRKSRFLRDPGGANEMQMLANCRVELQAGDTFRIEAPAGGGYGEPAKRSAIARQHDREDGYTN